MPSPQFIKIPKTVNMVGIKVSGRVVPRRGIWPLIDENRRLLNIIAIGNKNGLDKQIDLPWLKELFPTAKFIFSCQSGPYLVSHYQEILDYFDGHMTLDYDPSNPKSLFMNHSMMIRSLPFEGFFWEPEKEKRWDFSILTLVGDNKAKRWDRCLRVVDRLSSQGLSGLVVTQEGDFSRVLKARFAKERILRKYLKAGLLHLSGFVKAREFHRLQAMAHVGIFPNTCDAFPKNIIENILADKLVIVGDDLLMGRSVVAPEFGEAINFDSDSGLDKCLKIVQKAKLRKTPLNNRQRWLKKYGFLPLAQQWAEELKRKFKVNCQLAFFLNHLERVKGEI